MIFVERCNRGRGYEALRPAPGGAPATGKYPRVQLGRMRYGIV